MGLGALGFRVEGVLKPEQGVVGEYRQGVLQNWIILPLSSLLRGT